MLKKTQQGNPVLAQVCVANQDPKPFLRACESGNLASLVLSEVDVVISSQVKWFSEANRGGDQASKEK